MEKIYYKPENYWQGKIAIEKLAEASGVSEDDAKDFLFKQVMWQIYLPRPKYIPRGTTSDSEGLNVNEIHQADLLYLSHDKEFKYALTVVDVASRYKEAEPIKRKTPLDIKNAFQKIYDRSPLDFPKVLQIDGGSEFKGVFKKYMLDEDVFMKIGQPHNHRAQGIVERFNRTLAEQLYFHQQNQELTMKMGDFGYEWIENLPIVIKSLNNQKTRLINMVPAVAVKLKTKIKQLPSLPAHRPIGYDEERLDKNKTFVRFLYNPW